MSLKSRSRNFVALAPLISAVLGFAFVGCPSPHYHEGGGGGDTVGGIGGQGLTGLGGTPGTGGTTTGVGGAGNPGAGGRGAGGAGSGTDGGVAGASGVGGGTGVGGAGTGGGTGVGGAGTGGMGTGGMGTGGRGTGGSGGAYLAPTMPGQVVITEIMADSAGPPDESGEWFELYNPTNQTFDLKDCLLSDSSAARGNQNVVQTHVIIAPGAYVTMARFGDVSGGFSPTYNYHTTLADGGGLDPNADVKFNNNGDRVGITCGLIPIDVVDFTNWVLPLPKTSASGVPKGRTYSLDPTRLNAMDNDAPENWCTGGPAVYPVPLGPDRGTPGTANPPCTCALLACVPWM